MKSLVLISLLALLAVVTAQISPNCFSSANDFCSNLVPPDVERMNCRASFGGVLRDNEIFKKLSSYVNLNIDYSFRYLHLATNYSTYSHNRPGFEKLYRGLADTAWEDAQNLIHYITRRGGVVNLAPLVENVNTHKSNLNTVGSLAYALDLHKEVTITSHKIHEYVSKLNKSFDPDVSSYLETNFLHKHSEKVRELAGYMSDLLHLYKHTGEHEVSLSIFLFDEYLHSL